MSFFRKPIVALLLSAVLIAASTLLSVNVKFGSECEKVIDGFHDGVYYDGQMHESIASQLREIRGCADEIADIAIKNNIDAEELQWASDGVRYGLLYSDSEASYLYYCYEDLLDEVNSTVRELENSLCSEEDMAAVYACLDEIDAAKELIEHAGYNETVREFNRTHLRFPAEFLGQLAGVDFPEQFS